MLKCTWRDLGRMADLSVPNKEPVAFDYDPPPTSPAVPGVAPNASDPGTLRERRLDLLMHNYCTTTMKDAAFDVTVASSHCP